MRKWTTSFEARSLCSTCVRTDDEYWSALLRLTSLRCVSSSRSSSSRRPSSSSGSLMSAVVVVVVVVVALAIAAFPAAAVGIITFSSLLLAVPSLALRSP